jgi:hypothetical protein
MSMSTLLAPVSRDAAELERHFGAFDIGMDGQPRPGWIGRTLVPLLLKTRLQHYYFPSVYLTRILVNRRMAPHLAQVLEQMEKRWNYQERENNGLNQFVKCYCFGDGLEPTPVWWGSAYYLSPKVSEATIKEVLRFFTKAGFSWGGTLEPKDIRRFDYY